MFFGIGFVFVLAISVMFLRWKRWAKVVVATILCCIGTFSLYMVRVQSDGVTTRGNDVWWNSSPWKEVFLLVAMIGGMFLRVIWDAVEEYQKKAKRGGGAPTPVFSFWEFASPAIVSLIVFQPVLSMGEGQQMSIKLALFSLQNGFFWNTIFAKLRGSRTR